MCQTYYFVRILSTPCMLPPNISFGAVFCMKAWTTAQSPSRIDNSGAERRFRGAFNRQQPARKRGQVVQTGCGVRP